MLGVDPIVPVSKTKGSVPVRAPRVQLRNSGMSFSGDVRPYIND